MQRHDSAGHGRAQRRCGGGLRVLICGVLLAAVVAALVPDVAVAQTGSIVRGKVIDGEGNGLAGVRVTITPRVPNPDRPVDPIVVETNDDGDYLARNVFIGELRLVFESTGHASLIVDQITYAGQNRIDVTMTDEVVTEELARVRSANDAYSAGRDAFAAGDFAAVVGYMERALAATEDTPDNADALGYVYALLGRAHFEQRQFEEAVVAYRAWIERQPAIANPHIELAQALAALGRQDEAAAEFQAAVAINPADPVTHYNMGVTMVNGGNVPDGIVHIERAVELQPDYPLAYKNLGYAYMRVEAYAKAIGAFEKYLEQAPEAPDTADIQGFIVALKEMIG